MPSNLSPEVLAYLQAHPELNSLGAAAYGSAGQYYHPNFAYSTDNNGTYTQGPVQGYSSAVNPTSTRGQTVNYYGADGAYTGSSIDPGAQRDWQDNAIIAMIAAMAGGAAYSGMAGAGAGSSSGVGAQEAFRASEIAAQNAGYTSAADAAAANTAQQSFRGSEIASQNAGYPGGSGSYDISGNSGGTSSDVAPSNTSPSQTPPADGGASQYAKYLAPAASLLSGGGSGGSGGGGDGSLIDYTGGSGGNNLDTNPDLNGSVSNYTGDYSMSGLLSQYGKYLAPLLGAIGGSKPVTKTTTEQRTVDQRMVPYLYGSGTNPGLLGYTSQQLQRSMSPGVIAGYNNMQNVGQGLLNQPIAGNGFTKYFGGK